MLREDARRELAGFRMLGIPPEQDVMHVHELQG